uniref:Small ribosomal subunit protein uS2c n=1 Tax=Mesostigma viride TaxID=41882 RepID=G8DKD8_MESVI|nr:ribosomal protein S2 [Mesostigma viride]
MEVNYINRDLFWRQAAGNTSGFCSKRRCFDKKAEDFLLPIGATKECAAPGAGIAPFFAPECILQQELQNRKLQGQIRNCPEKNPATRCPSESFLRIRQACNIIYSVVKKGGSVLFISSGLFGQAHSKKIEEISKRCNQSFVTERWIGGILTNSAQISKNIIRLKSTKKEDLNFFKSDFKYRGLRDPSPSLIILFRVEEKPLREAYKKGIPIIALVDKEETKMSSITYPIDSSSWTNLFLEELYYTMRGLRKGSPVTNIYNEKLKNSWQELDKL